MPRGLDPEEAETLPCPYCGKQILGDALRCPYCEHYISDEDVPRSRKPWWIILGLAACFFAVYRWLFE